MNTSYLIRFCFIFFLFYFIACKSDQPSESSFTVRVRLNDEPDRLNPILSTTSGATHINKFIFQPLAEFNPFSMDYEPILLEDLPLPTIIENGPYKGELKYLFKIRDEAKWDNDTPITGKDVVFTAKCALLPQCASSGLAPYVESILNFELNESDPSEFAIVVNREYLLALEGATNWPILPQYHYDRQGILANYSYDQIRYPDQNNLDLAQDSALNRFSGIFTDEPLSRSDLSGSGAYYLVDWQANQYLSLAKKSNWWGEELSQKMPVFTNNPQRLVFQIIPDEQVAITSLKEGNVDLVEINDQVNFNKMKESGDSNRYAFHAHRQFLYFYFAMNNQHPILKEVEVRKAIAHILNVDEVIESHMGGYAQRTAGPINPASPNYNTDLKPIEYAPEKARTYLSQAGWEDTNQNGTVDKVINGALTECVLRVFVTQRPLGKNISLILQESAEKIGIKIDIVPLASISEIVKHASAGDFELAALGNSQSPGEYDPFQNWHTESYLEKSGNLIGFGNEESDRIIEQLREEIDPVKRKQWYFKFQEIVYDQQPVLFLFSPSKLFITSSRIKAQASILRPGYFENYFTLNPEFEDQ